MSQEDPEVRLWRDPTATESDSAEEWLRLFAAHRPTELTMTQLRFSRKTEHALRDLGVWTDAPLDVTPEILSDTLRARLSR